MLWIVEDTRKAMQESLEKLLGTLDNYYDDVRFIVQDERIECALNERVIKNITFQNCVFEELNFSDTVLENCVFMDCYFEDVNFLRLKGSLCTFRNCKFRDCGFPYVNMNVVNFNTCYFIACKTARAVFKNSIIEWSTFLDMCIYNAIFEKVRIDACSFNNIHFSYADFTGATFIRCLHNGCTFEESNMRGVVWDESVFQGCSFNFLRNIDYTWIQKSKTESCYIKGMRSIEQCDLQGFDVILGVLSIDGTQVLFLDTYTSVVILEKWKHAEYYLFPMATSGECFDVQHEEVKDAGLKTAMAFYNENYDTLKAFARKLYKED